MNKIKIPKGARYRTREGYIKLLCVGHPDADKEGYVLEHRMCVSRMVGRYLTKQEVVHHLDSNRENNNINNLMLFDSQKKHKSFENSVRKYGWTKYNQEKVMFRWDKK